MQKFKPCKRLKFVTPKTFEEEPPKKQKVRKSHTNKLPPDVCKSILTAEFLYENGTRMTIEVIPDKNEEQLSLSAQFRLWEGNPAEKTNKGFDVPLNDVPVLFGILDDLIQECRERHLLF